VTRERQARVAEKARLAGKARLAESRAAHASASAWTRAEQVARSSYGRLLAILAARTGDIEGAEDALAAAFERALRTWPDAGVPQNAEAWLLTVARNRQRDALKSASHRKNVPLHEHVAGGESPLAADVDVDAIPDERLALMFVCAHPAVDPGIRTPLMLQTVLGSEARQIARAFAVPSATMAQRLVRAKRRIRNARIPFVVPDRSQMPERMAAVLEAVYGAYAIDWWVVSGPTARESLAVEAHYLAVTLAELLGEEPEALGLAALLSLSLARAGARGAAEDFVPLEEQDPALWDGDLIGRGEAYLRRAHALGRMGRFQIEAAIQSVHCDRAVTGATDWDALRKLYGALVSIAPTLGARVAFAAAVGRIEGPGAGLAVLDEITDPALRRFQPAWATRAHLVAEAGRVEEARRAYAKAVSLTTEPGVRRYLEGRMESVVRVEGLTTGDRIPERRE